MKPDVDRIAARILATHRAAHGMELPDDPQTHRLKYLPLEVYTRHTKAAFREGFISGVVFVLIVAAIILAVVILRK